MKNFYNLLSSMILLIFAHHGLWASCANGTLTLTITLDNAPVEVNWELKDAWDGVYASGATGYGNQTPGTTITETMPAIPNGDYALVMYDVGGNGLCCSNGNGSYQMTDGGGNIIASGSIYNYSEISTFCYNTTNNDVFDLTPPSTVVLTASNITGTSVDLSWTTATDNEGIFGYAVMVNGVYAGYTNYTSVSLPFFQPCTSYDFNILVRDFMGNFSVFSNTESITTTCPPSSVVVHEGYFESGWDGWIDGGSDCRRYYGAKSAEGNYAIRIRDNSGVSSSMTSPDMDLSPYASVDVEFQYYHQGYENGEDFFLRLYENGAWTTVATFTRGVDFTSNGFYSASISLDGNIYNFGSNSKLRLQSDASNNNDRIFIDAVVVTGHLPISNMIVSEEPLLTANAQLIKKFSSDIGISTRYQKVSNQDVTIYPNPADDVVSIDGVDEGLIEKFEIYNIQGQLISALPAASRIDVSQLASGLLLIKIKLMDQSVIVKRCFKK